MPINEPHCFHCHLPIPADIQVHNQIENQQRDFCCHGCKSVCSIIYDSGLQGFYQRTPEGQTLAPPPQVSRDLALYDIDEVQSEFVNDLGQQRTIHLLVEGIHCAACVWLIERSLGKLPGIVDVKVNLANRRTHIRWDNQQVKLSAILQQLGKIGYAATPFDPEAAEGQIKKTKSQYVIAHGLRRLCNDEYDVDCDCTVCWRRSR